MEKRVATLHGPSNGCWGICRLQQPFWNVCQGQQSEPVDKAAVPSLHVVLNQAEERPRTGTG